MLNPLPTRNPGARPASSLPHFRLRQHAKSKRSEAAPHLISPENQNRKPIARRPSPTSKPSLPSAKTAASSTLSPPPPPVRDISEEKASKVEISFERFQRAVMRLPNPNLSEPSSSCPDVFSKVWRSRRWSSCSSLLVYVSALPSGRLGVGEFLYRDRVRGVLSRIGKGKRGNIRRVDVRSLRLLGTAG